ncbi:TPA: hypothetical protein DEP96_02500 [Candidatus Uhrbacteria bacterium]|nr:hypothetical protein [Candidatus Uhrbacteria bacterium]
MFFSVMLVPPVAAQEQVALIATTESQSSPKVEARPTIVHSTVAHATPPTNSWPNYSPHFVIPN